MGVCSLHVADTPARSSDTRATVGARSFGSMGVPEICAALESRIEGLSTEVGRQRLLRDGPNVLPSSPRISRLAALARQMTHPMACLLWVAGALAWVSGTPQLCVAIWAVVGINASFSFWQEFKAERALEALKDVLPFQARVVRDGELVELAAADLVRGDVVVLEEGDRISADMRLIEADRLTVDTSVLNGESTAVARHAEPALREGGTTLDLPNLVFAGCTVLAGRARGIVYATGLDTELGRVAHLVASVRKARSGLEIQVERIVRVISRLAIGVGAVVFLVAFLLAKMGTIESFVFAIGIVVALVPEGLLPMITLSLAISVQRMAKRNALVRRLSAIESLSAVNVICTDKTGTLTENAMTVRSVWVPDRDLAVSGSGYDPRGEVAAAPTLRHEVQLLLAGAALCSNARLVHPPAPGHWHIIGDPTEGALLVAAVKARLAPPALQHGAPRLREIAFESARRMMTVVVRWQMPRLWRFEEPFVAFTKGAPAEVVAACTHIMRHGRPQRVTDGDRAHVQAAVDRYAEQGFRVLGVALRPGQDDLLTCDAEAVERDMVFVGLTAMLDPPRPEVPAAMEACRRAGIRVTMVTGDYGLTAASIARKIGLATGTPPVVSGRELDGLDDAALDRLIRGQDGLVFARVTPQHKLRVVEAHKRCGDVVAVTGDGVNDAPALRAAHVGISMGRVGTDVAREASDIVLLDDNFATIVSAIEQGRTVFLNIRKFMTYVFASNVAELLPFIAMVALRVPPALTVLQILSIDLGTDLVPALGLGVEKAEAGVMNRPPLRTDALMNRSLLIRAYCVHGAIIGVLGLLAYGAAWASAGLDFEAVRAATATLLDGTASVDLRATYHLAMTACLTAIVCCQAGHVFACRSERDSVTLTGVGGNPLLWLGVGLELALNGCMQYFPAMRAVFDTAPLSVHAWLALLALAPLFLVFTEMYKAGMRARRGK